MAELSAAARARLSAVAFLRWRLFVNTLRDATGVMETVSAATQGLFFALFGLGGAAGFAVAGWYAAHADKPLFLLIAFVPVFFLWQVIPVFSAARFESEDISMLLRFPVRFGEFVALNLVYGALNIWTAISLLWLAAPLTAFALARHAYAGPALLVGALYAVANLAVSRATLACLERWLLRRRAREVLACAFLAFGLGAQFLPLIAHRLGARGVLWLLRAAWLLPPGLAARGLDAMSRGRTGEAAALLAGLAAWLAGATFVLVSRLRAQFAGELESDGRAPGAARAVAAPGWQVPGLSDASSAVFEKELRSLARNGPALFILAIPPIIVAVFRAAALHGARAHGAAPPAALSAALALPAGAAYCLLVLSNLVYNSFGSEGAGVQILFASPASVREIVVGKNAAFAAILTVQALCVWAVSTALNGAAPFDAAIATAVGLALIVPVDLAAGNLLSLLLPKKRELGVRQADKPSFVASLASMLVKLVLFALYIPGILLADLLPPVAGASVLVALAGASWTLYALSLDASGPLALQRRDALLAELCRA